MRESSAMGRDRNPAGGAPAREFVDFERYQSLLVSRRPIQRADDAPRGHCGLLDRDTGALYLIAEEHLERPSRSYAS